MCFITSTLNIGIKILRFSGWPDLCLHKSKEGHLKFSEQMTLIKTTIQRKKSVIA